MCLGKGQRPQHPSEHVGQDVNGGLASLLPAKRQVFALWRRNLFERRHIDALLGREAGGGLSRCAVGFDSGGNRRARDELLEIGLALSELGDADRESPGCAVRLGGRLGREPFLVQLGDQHLADLLSEARQPACRNLLAADFEQQFTVHYAPSP
jgi:hypothetical protein